MIEMIIDSVRVSLANHQRVVLLRERSGVRFLPIWIGPSEADVIASKLHDVQMSRPLTHDLIVSVIADLGASVKEVVITELRDNTFYANVILQAGTAFVVVDSRPSDAITVALYTKAPIYAEEEVLEKAGVKLDEETEQVSPEGGQPESEQSGQRPVSPEELKSLEPFRDIVDELLGEGDEPPEEGGRQPA